MPDELVALVTVDSSEEASMLCEMLENAGIASVVSGSLDRFFGKMPAFGVKVFVRAADLERAREIYQAYFQTEVAVPEEDHEPPTD